MSQNKLKEQAVPPAVNLWNDRNALTASAPSHEITELLERFRAIRGRIKGTVDIPSLFKEGRKY